MVALCVFWDCVSGAAGKGSALPTGKGKLANEDDGKRKTNERRGREKEKQRTKTKNAVGNGAVEFYSRNIGKLDKNRADVTGGLSKRTRKGKLANEEDGKRNEEDGKRNEKKRRGNGKERREREKEKEKRRKRKREEDSKRESGTGKGRRRRKPGNTAGNAGVKFDAGSKGKLTKNRPDETGGSPKRRRRGKEEGKESAKSTRKGTTGPEKQGDDGNPETQPGTPEPQPGTPVSSLMQVQKENSPKTVPTRPAALRRGAEKEKRRNRKREDGSESRNATGKGMRRRKPGTAAGNAGVKFDAGSKGKLAKNRPDETRGPPKRRRKGKKKEQKARRRLGKQNRNRKPSHKHDSGLLTTFSTRVRSIIHTAISFPACTKTVLQK